MNKIEHKALLEASRYLDSVGAVYAVRFRDGSTAGELPVADGEPKLGPEHLPAIAAALDAMGAEFSIRGGDGLVRSNKSGALKTRRAFRLQERGRLTAVFKTQIESLRIGGDPVVVDVPSEYDLRDFHRILKRAMDYRFGHNSALTDIDEAARQIMVARVAEDGPPHNSGGQNLIYQPSEQYLARVAALAQLDLPGTTGE